MVPSDFYRILALNVDALRQSPGDVRCAVNAILSADAFFGIFAAAKGQDDKPLKDALASTNHAWRLLRDTAFSLKHGQLTGKITRLVVSPSAVVTDGLRWDDLGTWNDQITWADTEGPYVLIEHSSTRLRADLVAVHVLALADDTLNNRPSQPVSLNFLKSQGVFS